MWSLVSIGAFVLTLFIVQRPSDWPVPWTFFLIGAVLLMLPMIPGFGRA